MIIIACLFLGACQSQGSTIDSGANATIIAAGISGTLTAQASQALKIAATQTEITQTVIAPIKASPSPVETFVSATPLPEPSQSPTPVPSPTNSVPTISFTYVPPRGSSDYVTGKVTGVDTKEYVIVIYIKVGKCWWNRPFFDTTAPILPDGTWSAQYATGQDHDVNAKIIRAYLFDKGWSVPYAVCNGHLPSELDKILMVEVTR
jgi:hypothetical protein